MFVAVTVTPLRKVKVVSFAVLTISADPLSMTVGTGGVAGAGAGAFAAAGSSAHDPRGSNTRASRHTDAQRRIISGCH
jgi:hypothetical protein